MLPYCLQRLYRTRPAGTKKAPCAFRLRLLGLCAGLLTACHDGPFDDPPALAEPWAVTATIADLHRQAGDRPMQVTGDWVVSGRVTTSDVHRNFYRTFCLEADGAAVEVMAGGYRLSVDLPEGSEVAVRLQGLTLGRVRGVLQIGTAPAAGSNWPTGYFASAAALDRHVRRISEQRLPVVPTRLTVSELTPAHCGRLVTLEGMRYAPEGIVEWGWRGMKRFCEEATGAAVYTFVREEADFAGREVPFGRCSLTGILQYEPSADGGTYLIKLRDETDCAF